MNIERYLDASAKALRNDVLPTLPPSPARDQVVNCIRVLTRVAIALEKEPDAARALLDDDTLPAALKDAFRASEPGTATPFVGEDIVVDAGTTQGMANAARWIMSQPWVNDVASTQTVKKLLAWDRQQRDARLARMATAEAPPEATVTGALSGAKLTEEVLQRYLQQKLANPALKVEQYRSLPGGRTRKTIVFRQTGQADWPEWLVVQCDPPPGYHSFPGVSSQFPVMAYAHQGGKLKVPRPMLLELEAEPFGTPFMIVEKLPGSPPTEGINFFAPPPPSEALALDMARQLAALHSLPVGAVEKSIPVILPDASGWAGELEKLIGRIDHEFQGPSLSVSAGFAWMKQHVGAVQNTVSLVHGDYLQHNMLVQGDTVSGILDWEGVRVGHPGEDLGYVRPMIEQMTSWDKFMAAYHEAGGPTFSREEADYFTLRAYILMLTFIAHSKNSFEGGSADDIRSAEVGCSLAPLFINCVATTMEKILSAKAP